MNELRMDAQLIPLKQITGVGVLRHNRQSDVTRGAIGPVDVGASPRSVIAASCVLYDLYSVLSVLSARQLCVMSKSKASSLPPKC